VSFVEGDIFALPFDDASFDIVGTIRTLHHLDRPSKRSKSWSGSLSRMGVC